MSKVIDITDKLNFEEKFSIKIKDTVIAVNNDAPSMLEVAAILGDESLYKTPEGIKRLAELLFDAEEHQKIVSLKLDIRDYVMTIMQTARVAANQYNKDEGEIETPAMI